MADRKKNPRFLMGAPKGRVEKQLDEIAEKPKRVVRRDWSRPAIAITDSVEEVDLKPALANNEIAIDFESDEFEDEAVEGVTVEPAFVASNEDASDFEDDSDNDDEFGVDLDSEVDDEGLPLNGSPELLPVVKAVDIPVVDLDALQAFDEELDSEVDVKVKDIESQVEDNSGVDKLDTTTSISSPVVAPEVVKPVRRVNPAFNLGVSSSPKVVHRDEHVVDEDSSDTDSWAESGTEATLRESPSLSVVRPGKLPVKKPAPRFLGGGVTRAPEKRNEYGEGVVSPKAPTAPVEVRRAFPTAKPEEQHRDQRAHVLKAKSGVEAADWTSDTSKDTNKGFGGEGNIVHIEPELGVGFHLTERDILIIRFLARYRYAYSFQIARLVNASVKSVNPRLRKLAERGFIRKQTVTGNQHIWLSTKAGNLVTDIDLPAIKEGSLSWVTVAHTLGLVNIGVELEIGGDNLLKEGVWPTYNRVDVKGDRVLGERIISEKEIRQGQQKWRMNRTTAEMREVVESAIKDPGELKPNNVTGEMEYLDAPELIEGNEGLYVIYGGVEHIPDMVVSRGRDADGKPINIAIELELNPKTTEDWRRILRTYRDFGDMYSKVIYFTHKRTIFNLLNKINKEDVGLPPEKFLIRQYQPKNGREPFWG